MQEPIRSTEIILPLLQLIALTLPVLAILAQVMVRVTITERDIPPSKATIGAFISVGVAAVFLGSAAISLIDELQRLVQQNAISQAGDSLITAFGFLSTAIILVLYESRHVFPDGEDKGDDAERTNTGPPQSQLTDFEEDTDE